MGTPLSRQDMFHYISECRKGFLQNWALGIPLIGKIQDTAVSEGQFILNRTQVQKQTTVGGKQEWTDSEDDRVFIPVNSEFLGDDLDLGRMEATLPNGTLATFYPSTLDPRLPLTKSK